MGRPSFRKAATDDNRARHHDRAANLADGEKRSHTSPRPAHRSASGDDNIINRYNPVRDVACSIVQIPYGAVGVAGRGLDIRTHEIHVDNRDASGFLPPIYRSAERQPWARWVAEQEAREARSIRRIHRAILRHRAASTPASAATQA